METTKCLVLLFVTAILLNGFCSVSAASPAQIAGGLFSNAISILWKQLWSLKSSPKTAISGRSMMKFESGYTVETVFDGSKLGIEPHAVEMSPSGDLLILDSANSNIHRVSLPLSKYSRPKLVAGSAEGYSGHVDGKPREARMNHPKGFTVDDKGNIYVADAMNMAVRKISASGITTIAGGKWNRGGHIDGASEDAKFSTDFEVVYIGSSCSLLVIDRGNQAIREIQLHFDDCAYHYETGFPLGIAVLLAAGFFGYMLALLQKQVGLMFSSASTNEPQTRTKPSMPPYQKPMKRSLQPPLIPPEDETTNHEDEEGGYVSSIGKLLGGIKSSTLQILGAVSLFSKKKPPTNQSQPYNPRDNPWPSQESFVVPDDEPPPPLEGRTPNPKRTYAFMSKEPQKIHHLRHAQPNYFNGWDGDHHHQQQQQQRQQQQVQYHRHYSSGPQTYYEQSYESNNEIVFGAVQEMDSKRRGADIRAMNYEDHLYEQYGIRYRNSYMGYSNNN
ncbi:hypothetical protein ACMD2_14419 [Ananas comosus]|uniref:NHL repeat-containing protein 2 n=1 Tax=Ananas comosus TaxID=4615 RepID=A0A199WA38_ANACO|nr:hypothetical protein ACMD2_14419 [Ananas comosus]